MSRSASTSSPSSGGQSICPSLTPGASLSVNVAPREAPTLLRLEADPEQSFHLGLQAAIGGFIREGTSDLLYDHPQDLGGWLARRLARQLPRYDIQVEHARPAGAVVEKRAAIAQGDEDLVKASQEAREAEVRALAWLQAKTICAQIDLVMDAVRTEQMPIAEAQKALTGLQAELGRALAAATLPELGPGRRAASHRLGAKAGQNGS